MYFVVYFIAWNDAFCTNCGGKCQMLLHVYTSKTIMSDK